jgi:hypothetical protein
MKTTAYFVALFCLIGLFSNCIGVSRARHIQPDLMRSAAKKQYLERQTGDSIRFQYIGCGGFLIQYGNEGVLLDPYFSNANVLKNAFQTLHSDTILIDNFFTQNFKKPRDTEGGIQTVLIAHAHHDHLADLPSLLKRNLSTEKITLIGSQTMSNLIQSYGLPLDAHRQILSFDTLFDKKNSPLREIRMETQYSSSNGRLRITAVKTEHAPHILRMKLPFIGGEVLKIPPKPPQTSLDFKEGVNYNFMIDFLNADGSINFRIFSNAGAGANAPIGFPPSELLEEKKVDVLLICGANYNQVKGYPQKLVTFVKPEKVIVSHWEDFFTPIPELLKKTRVVPFTNIPEFLKILKKTMVENGIEPLPIIVQPLTPIWIKF